MSIERMIEDRRTRNNTHESSLINAKERMRLTNNRLKNDFKNQHVTPELLEKVISL